MSDTPSSAAQPKRSAEQIELEKLPRRNAKLEADLAKTRIVLDIMGKSACALGRSLRERGERRGVDDIMTTAFTELRAAEISVMKSCVLTGISRATHYRHPSPKGVMYGPWLPRRPLPQALTELEQAQVLDLLNNPAYRDLAIPEVWARELDEGRYWCSTSTMYRIARTAGRFLSPDPPV